MTQDDPSRVGQRETGPSHGPFSSMRKRNAFQRNAAHEMLTKCRKTPCADLRRDDAYYPEGPRARPQSNDPSTKPVPAIVRRTNLVRRHRCGEDHAGPAKKPHVHGVHRARHPYGLPRASLVHLCRWLLELSRSRLETASMPSRCKESPHPASHPH